MTRVTFLHGAADRQQAALHWLAMAARAERSVMVCLPSTEQLEHFDRLLWTHSALDFIPHCRIGDPLAADTPIVLSTRIDNPRRDTCVLNLTNAVPAGFDDCDELVEIVSIHDEDRLPGRERFRFYREHGHTLDSQDISGGTFL